MNFDKLKNRAGKGIESLQQKAEELNGGGGRPKDERFWNMTFDSTSSGSAVIRFLPASEDENPMAKEVSYFFRGPGGVYSELSPISIGKECPVRDRNGQDWQAAEAAGDEDGKNQVRKRKQNVKFYANILVIDDPANPDNNGKVFLFKFGKQIKKIIDKAIKPEYADEKPVDPFDLWFGANFKFRSKGREVPDSKTGKKIMVPNYEDSKFDDVSELFPGDDGKKEEVWKQTYSLGEFVDPSRYKEYDVLEKQMNKVLGGRGPAKSAAEDDAPMPMQDQDKPAATADSTPAQAPAERPAEQPSAPETPKESPTPTENSAQDDDMAFFDSL